MTTRREFLKLTGATSAAMLVAQLRFARAFGDTLMDGLSDPALQPKFVNLAPNALHPDFIYKPYDRRRHAYAIAIQETVQMTGLVGSDGVTVPTPVWGYGAPFQGQEVTWPGRTFIAKKGKKIRVTWLNQLRRHNFYGKPLPHLLPVDESLHWAYSLPGYEHVSIDKDGVPIVAHLHGGHSKSPFDGNPEFFFSPGFRVRGPQWKSIQYVYHNDQVAGNLWYHDHALGITRLNVYAGLAGFYFIRDKKDTGKPNNPLGLPAYPYEMAYAIQDRMFRDTGELFYPAFPGEPAYADFITGEGADLPPDIFPNGGPTALAEFFGDHMVVNGMIWPKENVERRHYRMHLLNGTDSRFLVIRFRVAATPSSTDLTGAGAPIPFTVIGSDQGLAAAATVTDTLISEPGSRYDVVVDFSQVPAGSRVIMENIGGDAPFGGDYGSALDPDDFFPNRQTDRIMAFDVTQPLDTAVPDNFNAANITGIYNGISSPVDRTRKVALFEGKDEFGRLQPLLGTAEPATDFAGNPINWPNTPEYINAGLVGQMEGSIAWHSPTTENPALNTTEEWEVWNATGDAHPVHLHLVHFDVLGRQEIAWDSHTTPDDRVIPNDSYSTPAGDGTYLVTQPVIQHNGEMGEGFRLANLTTGPVITVGSEYIENSPKDMVTALPDQVTRIKATFDRPGRYVWHCHILSHEDHEMMRVLHIGPGA